MKRANQSLSPDEARRLLDDYDWHRADSPNPNPRKADALRERILALLTGRPDTIASGEFVCDVCEGTGVGPIPDVESGPTECGACDGAGFAESMLKAVKEREE